VPVSFWIKSILTFFAVAALGLFWADYKYRMGKKAERFDETARWFGLILYFGRWVVVVVFLIGMFWAAVGHK
jgi:hypothetical protein